MVDRKLLPHDAPSSSYFLPRRKLEYTLIKNLQDPPTHAPSPISDQLRAPQNFSHSDNNHLCNLQQYAIQWIMQCNFSPVFSAAWRQLQMSPPPLSLSAAFIGRLGHTSHWNTVERKQKTLEHRLRSRSEHFKHTNGTFTSILGHNVTKTKAS